VVGREREVTRRQALAEARRRWGQSGAVELDAANPLPAYRCRVGRRSKDRFGGRFERQGHGETWAAAFADADANAARLGEILTERQSADVKARGAARRAHVAERRRS
jgi:hypothetical protein